MTMQSVNIGAAPNDHIGDAIRVAFDKVNDNFTDLYASFEGVNVKWYGAKGDGITDDTAAIQAALVASNNIFFPAGTFLCNLNITNNKCNIIGSGIRNTILKDFNGTDPVVKFNATANHIVGCKFEGFQIDGNNLVDCLKIETTLPFVFTDSIVQYLYLINSKKAVDLIGVIYKNSFSNILTLYSDYGIFQDANGTYNTFKDIEISGVNNGGYAIYTTCAISVFLNISTEGIIRNDGAGNNFINVTIETISGNPPSDICFRNAGDGTKIDLTLVNIDPAKCTYGLAIFNQNHIIYNLRAYGTVPTDTPTYLFSPDTAATGIIINMSTQGAYKAHDYMTPAQLQNWKILNGDFFVDLLKKVVYSTAAPASGTWAVGDICYNTTPTSGGYIGWVCTTAPGTFKGFGLIA